MTRRSGCALAAVAALAAGCGGRGSPLSKPAEEPPPRLVVLVVIDQLPSWTFEARRASFVGGLRRLLDRGVYVARARIPYGSPLTAPGHATLSTGTSPAIHGVIGNSWYRRADGRVHDAEYDATAKIFTLPGADAAAGGAGSTRSPGASGRAMRSPGLAEALHLGTGGRGQAVAVGLKARAACFLAGQHPDAVVFFDAEAGGMTTSSAYASEQPEWLLALAKVAPVSQWLTATWKPLDAAQLAAATGLVDAAPGEGAEYDFGVTFPHRLATSAAPIKALSATPFGDTIVLDAARVAVAWNRLGADEVPDLLAISLNSHDFAGHNWGQGSWEEVDLLARLDLQLGAFFAFLDERVGAEHYAVVLTSDHGATPLLERSRVPGARRIPPAEIVATAEQAMSDRLGPGPWVANLSSGNLYLHEAARGIDPGRLEPALDAAAAAIRQLPGIVAAGRFEPLLGAEPGDCRRGSDVERAMCRMAAPGARGELYVAPASGSLITSYTTGTHHDAPSDDNQLVPLVIATPGVPPRLEAAQWTTLSIAPTVAALLGVAPPADATAPPLPLVRVPRDTD
ncbi:MAG: alkaline phosphatase family protein [Kofleriaceae bacterium]